VPKARKEKKVALICGANKGGDQSERKKQHVFEPEQRVLMCGRGEARGGLKGERGGISEGPRAARRRNPRLPSPGFRRKSERGGKEPALRLVALPKEAAFDGGRAPAS